MNLKEKIINCFDIKEFNSVSKYDNHQHFDNDEANLDELTEETAEYSDDEEDSLDCKYFRCLYLVCKKKKIKFRTESELKDHLDRFHKPVDSPTKPNEINSTEIVKTLNKLSDSTENKHGNYIVSKYHRSNAIYLGLTCNFGVRDHEQLILASLLYSINKVESFKFKEITKDFDNKETIFFISNFNQDLKRKQAFATETAGLSFTDYNHFPNLLNRSERSINLDELLKQEEIDNLSNLTYKNFLNSDRTKMITVREIEIKTKPTLDYLIMNYDINKMNERQIVERCGVIMRNMKSSRLNSENKIVLLWMFKESKSKMLTSFDYKLQIVKELTEYDLDDNDAVHRFYTFYARFPEEKLDEELDYYRIALNDDIKYQDLIKNTSQLYQSKISSTYSELLYFLFKRIASNILLFTNFDSFTSRELLIKVYKHVSIEYFSIIEEEFNKQQRITSTNPKRLKIDDINHRVFVLFKLLEWNKEQSQEIIIKFAEAFEIHLQPYITPLKQELYLCKVFEINICDRTRATLSPDGLYNCLVRLVNIEREKVDAACYSNRRGREKSFEKRINERAKFLNLKIEDVTSECIREIDFQINLDYDEEYIRNLHLHLEFDSNYKIYDKACKWFELHYEQRTGATIAKREIHTHYTNSIIDGSPFRTEVLCKALRQKYQWLEDGFFKPAKGSKQTAFVNVVRKRSQA